MQLINIRIVLTFALVVLFFLGGIFLDYTASKRWVNLADPTATETNKEVVELARKQGDNLAASAKVLYDFAKISLGVLLTLLATSNTVAAATRMIGLPPLARTNDS
jgi:hypothetical protein